MKVYRVDKVRDKKTLSLLGDEKEVYNNGYYSYNGNELRIGKVECSNKLVVLLVTSVFRIFSPIYVDLENGNIVSAYRPGGSAFLLGNLINFYSRRNHLLEVSNMVYWLEALLVGDIYIEDLGYHMAENFKSPTFLSFVLLEDKNVISVDLKKYLIECCFINSIMYKSFKKRKYSELNLVSVCSKDGVSMFKVGLFSYIRARNRDYKLFYCRDDSSYYVKLSNKLNIGGFCSKDLIVRSIRDFHYLKGNSVSFYISNGDESLMSKFHDFTLDLEKIGKVLDLI